MKDLLNMVGLSKQALWKHHKREYQRKELTARSLSIMRKIRSRHKKMGCRAMYYASTEQPEVGRDRFESIGLENGFRLMRPKNKRKTTWSQTVEVFPNRIEGTEVKGINKVWQSDIFYVDSLGKTYYGITIIDVYSRKLLALHLSKSLRAEENVRAFKSAVRIRKGHNLLNCVFHSDRGSQYISEAQKRFVRNHGMISSMCKLPQENAYAERVQETIKNYYLCDETLDDQNLNSVAKRIMKKYNEERPHSELSMKTPHAYESYVENLPLRHRPKLLIYKWDHTLSTKSEFLTKRKK